MSDLKAAAQQALEAMEYSGMDVGKFNRINAACQALRAALAEPVQEPVAKVELMTSGGNAGLATRIVEIDDHLRERLRPGQLLYTSPPQRTSEPVQEPVAWRYKKEGGGWFVSDNEPQYVEQWNDIEEIQPLYTAPPQRKPLTEEEIIDLWAGVSDPESPDISMIDFARAIERAHGITP